jgi:hypothetical protein
MRNPPAIGRFRPTLSDGGAVACIVALSAVFAATTFRPAMARAEREREERESLATKTLALREADDSLTRTIQLRDHLREQRASLVTLGTLSDLNARLAEIPVVAESHGVAVSEVVPGTPQQRARLTRVPIRVAGVASFRAFTTMLADLHQRHRDLEVTSFSIDAEGSGKDAAARFTLAILWHTTSAPEPADSNTRSTGAARDDRAAGAGPDARPVPAAPR